MKLTLEQEIIRRKEKIAAELLNIQVRYEVKQGRSIVSAYKKESTSTQFRLPQLLISK